MPFGSCDHDHSRVDSVCVAWQRFTEDSRYLSSRQFCTTLGSETSSFEWEEEKRQTSIGSLMWSVLKGW